MEICNYGCGQLAKFKLKNGKNCCSCHQNKCQAIREKNSNGLKQAYTSGKKLVSFTDVHREKSKEAKLANSISNAFVLGSRQSNHYIKRLLIQEMSVAERCNDCGINEWQGQKIPLELDHIDGNSSNNTLENLRLLCPNCHSLTDTWRGRSINTGKKIVSDDDLRKALNTTPNVRQALISVGLSPRGANYIRAYKLKRPSGEIGETHQT